MKTAGYEPAITLECGRVTNILLELNGILCNQDPTINNYFY